MSGLGSLWSGNSQGPAIRRHCRHFNGKVRNLFPIGKMKGKIPANIPARTFWQKYRNEYSSLIRLGFPVLLTQLGVIMVAFADTMMVGAYGVRELAAAAFVNSLYLIPLVMLMGLAAGITPLVGALFGRGDVREPGRVARAGIQINVIVALAFTAVMGVIYFFLDRFGQPEELLPLIRVYYLILLLTPVPMAIFNACQQTANGLTDTATPMWCILFAVVFNIFFNWLLIYGNWGFPELGLAGAGIATLFARIAGMLAIMLFFVCSRRYRKCHEGFRRGGRLGQLRRKVWGTSYPVMIQNGVECSLWSFGAVVCGWFGTVQLASYQVANTIGQLGFMTYMSFGVAVAIRVANYSGVRDENGAGLAARAGLHLNLVLATIASAIFLIGGTRLLALFSPDPMVIAAGMLLLPPLVLYQYGDAVQLTFCNAIRGTSQVRPLLWISVISYMVVGVPVLLLFAKVFGWQNEGVYYSFSVALFVAAAIAWYVFRGIKLR